MALFAQNRTVRRSRALVSINCLPANVGAVLALQASELRIDMPDASLSKPSASSVDTPPRKVTAATDLSRAGYSYSTLAAMILMGYLPLLHLAAVVTVFILLDDQPAITRCSASLATLYLLPALTVRFCLFIKPLPEGNHSVNSSAFLFWWFTAQWQIVFNRLPLLEELLRMVPGLYSAWLRLWGARIGKLVYWSPGVLLLDRPLVEIGDQVVFGSGVRINPHVILSGAYGPTLAIARVRVGTRAMLGGYSLVMAGSVIQPYQTTAPLRMVVPDRELRHAALAEESSP